MKWEPENAARHDAALTIRFVRQYGNDEPIVWITSNAYVPPLREIGTADGFYFLDDEGSAWETYAETFEMELERANIYMASPDYDNALYCVDLRKWEYVDEDEEAETLSDEWRRKVPLPLERAYRKVRTDHPSIGASSAMRWAREVTAERPEWDWPCGSDSATREVDGFTITLEVQPDEYGDSSWLGEFSNSYSDGAIVNPESRWDNRVYPWFVPAITAEEHRQGLRAMGIGRHEADCLARSYVRRDMEMLRELALYSVRVRVERNGIELASDGIYSVQFSDDFDEARRYAEDMAEDMVPDAIKEAREAIANLTNKEGN